MQTCVHTLRRSGTLAFLMLAVASAAVFASSHMDAPLITLDDPANTTDVYAFVSPDAADGDCLIRHPSTQRPSFAARERRALRFLVSGSDTAGSLRRLP